MTTGGPQVPYEFESVAEDIVARSKLSADRRQVLTQVLNDRMRANYESQSGKWDRGDVQRAIRTIVDEIAKVVSIESDGSPASFSERDVNALIDSLCKRFHFPWPVCPANA
jgi:hypothetical protein